MTDDERQDAILAELRKMSFYLALLAGDKIAEKRSKLEVEYLTTPQRRQMWELMDGARNLSEIAGEVHVSSEAVRLFVNDLERAQIVEIRLKGSRRYPRRLI
jgi:hypothetical protein